MKKVFILFPLFALLTFLNYAAYGQCAGSGVPVIPDYDADFSNHLPDACWTEASSGSPGAGPTGFVSDWRDGASGYPGFSSSNKINLYFNDDEEWLIGPKFDLTGGSHELILNVAVTDWNSATLGDDMGSDDQVQVLMTTDSTNWTVIHTWTFSNQPSLNGEEFQYDLSSIGTTGTVQFAIWASDGTINDLEDYDFHVGRFEVRMPPSCYDPSDLSATPTPSNVLVDWVDNNPTIPVGWEVEYGATGFTQGLGTKMTSTSKPLGISGLANLTDYDFYVRAACGSNDSSKWVGPYTFNTQCGTILPNYATDFSTHLPICWTEAGSGNPSSGPVGTSSDWRDGVDGYVGFPNSNKVNLYQAVDEEWLISPLFDLTGGGMLGLKVNGAVTDYNSSTNSDVMGSDDSVCVLMTLDGTTWSNLHTWKKANQPSESGDEFTYDLTGIGLTGTVQFAIWATDGSIDNTEDYDFHIGQFEVKILPECLEPTDVSILNITTTSADLGWTQAGGSLAWDIEYGVTGFTMGNGTLFSTTANPHTLSGLMPNTSYTFYVSNVCLSSSSFWSGPYTFLTSCPSFSTPYTQSFDGSIAVDPFDGIPCWRITGNGAEDIELTSSLDFTGTIPSTPNCVEFNEGEWDAFTPDSAILISPQFTDLPDGDNQLRFKLAFENTLSDLYIFTIDDPYDLTTLSPYDTLSVADIGGNSGEFVEIIIPMDNTSAIGTNEYFAFAHGTDIYEVYIDDFYWEEIPSCPTLVGLSALNTGGSDIEVSFMDNFLGGAPKYLIEYGLKGFNQGTGTTITTTMSPYEITGLSSGDTFDIYAAAICIDANPGGDTSVWTMTQVIIPPLGQACLNPLTQSVVENCSSSTPTTYDFSLAVELGATQAGCDGITDYGYWVKFTAPGSGAVKMLISGSGVMDVGIGVYESCGTSAIECENNNLDDGDDLSVFGLTPGEDYYFFIWRDVQSQSADLCIEEICSPPTSLDTSNVGFTTIDLSWTVITGDEWLIEYDLTGFIEGSGINQISTTSNPTTLSGLTPGETYDARVSTVCGIDTTSSALITFRMNCGLLTPEYLQGFNSFMPGCWSQLNGGSFPSWGSDAFANDASHPNGQAARFNIYLVDADTLMSPEFDLSGGDYMIEHHVAATEYTSSTTGAADAIWEPDDSLTLNITTDGGLTWTPLLAYHIGNNPGSAGIIDTVDLSMYSGIVQFAYIASSTVNGSEDIDVFVDNFHVFHGPIGPCPPSIHVTGNPMSGVHQAGINVTSDATIDSPKNVIFKAGTEISLGVDDLGMNAEFEVETGAVFETLMNPCAGSTIGPTKPIDND